jgi:hypothetical protein
MNGVDDQHLFSSAQIAGEGARAENRLMKC